MSDTGTLPAGMETALEQSTKEVFETMIFMTVETREQPRAGARVEGDHMIASLGFTGSMAGVLLAEVDMSSAKQITANMLGMEVEEIGDDSEVCDAMGEIANMIAGNVKNGFVDQGMTMDLAVPAVSVGTMAKEQERTDKGVVSSRIAFDLEGGACFSVEIRVQQPQ